MTAFNPQKNPNPVSAAAIQSTWIPWSLLCVMLGIVNGWVRLSITGFAPVWISAAVATVVALGILQALGKLDIRMNRGILPILLAGTIATILLIAQWAGMSIALPGRDTEHFRNAWLLDSIREPLHWFPSMRAGGITENTVNPQLWLLLHGLEWASVAALTWVVFAFKRPHRKPSGRLRTYRMPLLLLALMGTLIWANRPHLAEQRTQLEEWVAEVKAKPLILELHQHIQAIGTPKHSPEYLALERVLDGASRASSPVPEFHLLRFHEEMLHERNFLSREAIDRAVYAAEILNRRTWLSNGISIDRNQLRAYLYHIRGKIHLQSERYLLAERDLSIALIHYEETLASPHLIPSTGFFVLPAHALPKAEIPGPYDASTAYLDRHIARKALGDEVQANSDYEMSQAVVLVHPDRK